MALQESAPSNLQLVNKIDKALVIYYESMKKNDYINNGVGKFTAWCDENGFEDDDIRGELTESGAQQCTAIEFDANFPLDPPIDDEKQRNEQIYDILKYCYEYGKPPPILTISSNYINLTLNEAKSTYKDQLKCLNELQSHEQSLMDLLALGYINGIAFATYIADAFTHDKVAKFVQSEGTITLNVGSWSKEPFMNKLKQVANGKIFKIAKNNIDKYCDRIIPRLQFQPLIKIDDNIEIYAKYLIATTKLIHKIIAETESKTFPFQIDLQFVVKKVEGNISDASDNLNEEKDDEAIDDCIQSLQDRLKNCVSFEYDDVINIEKIDEILYEKCFNGFKEKMKNKENYPKLKRFCVLLDRREEGDKIIFYEPPVCDTIPSAFVHEWHFESLLNCILPNPDDDDKNHSAKDNLNGQLMTFSFFVENIKDIKCYVIWNGQTMRFKGEHIHQVLKLVFKDTNENKKFVQQTEYAKQFNEMIEDNKFQLFYSKPAKFCRNLKKLDKVDIRNE